MGRGPGRSSDVRLCIVQGLCVLAKCGGASYVARTMIKAVFKTVLLLGILFVMLYVGMNNTHEIDFRFPIAGWTDKKPVHGSAALIYFGVLAVGVLAGTIFHSLGGSGSDKGGGKKSSSKDR